MHHTCTHLLGLCMGLSSSTFASVDPNEEDLKRTIEEVSLSAKALSSSGPGKSLKSKCAVSLVVMSSDLWKMRLNTDVATGGSSLLVLGWTTTSLLFWGGSDVC